MSKLPFLISIPHGGTQVPAELEGRVCLGPHDLLDDSDAYTREIYNAGTQAECVVIAEAARAFVDLNREPGMVPPAYPDGVVKSATCYGVPVYTRGLEPDEALTAALLEKYYHPYHHRIDAAMKNPNVLMGLDCHTMAEVPPAVATDLGDRPLFNLGDAGGTACKPAVTQLLKKAIMQAFDVSDDDVLIGYPFQGGYITRRHGNRPKPWIQIEMNRSLYLKMPWFDRELLQMDPERLLVLNTKFLTAMERFQELLAGR